MRLVGVDAGRSRAAERKLGLLELVRLVRRGVENRLLWIETKAGDSGVFNTWSCGQ